MRNEDFDAFAEVIADICAAYDRPATDERKRVFWDVLKHLHLLDVKRAADSWKRSQRKMPTPIDLKPERSAAPPPRDPIDSEQWSTWAMAANKILLAVAYFDERRGFFSAGDLMPKLLAIKRDFVQMAEEAAANGAPWEPEEFNRACREGFEQALGTKGVA